MVQILQTLLQMYAGTQIFRARAAKEGAQDTKPEEEVFDRLLQIETDRWEAEIRKASSDVSPSALKTEVQRSMETIVLGLESGSTAQQVQAEYLRELVARIEQVEKTLGT